MHFFFLFFTQPLVCFFSAEEDKTCDLKISSERIFPFSIPIFSEEADQLVGTLHNHAECKYHTIPLQIRSCCLCLKYTYPLMSASKTTSLQISSSSLFIQNYTKWELTHKGWDTTEKWASESWLFTSRWNHFHSLLNLKDIFDLTAESKRKFAFPVLWLNLPFFLMPCREEASVLNWTNNAICLLDISRVPVI